MGTNIISESRLKFEFPEDNSVIKFDDTRFYRECFNGVPGSKGVDFISVDKNKIAFIEIKNCTEDEGNCRWRIAPNNTKRDTAHTKVDTEGRDSLDIEVAQKMAMTMAALIGAKSFENTKICIEELQNVIDFISSKVFSADAKNKIVILFLEGDFASKTRTKKMIMTELQKSIKKKMKWFNCRVSVVDSSTCDSGIFQVVD